MSKATPKHCAACGRSTLGLIRISGTLICRDCEPGIRADMAKIKAAGGTAIAGHVARARLRHNVGAPYMLRDIPGDLWERVKIAGIKEKRPVRDIIIDALNAYTRETN